MTTEERSWFDKCPKAVLFEIARRFGSLIAGAPESPAHGFRGAQTEWEVLHANGIVPQKPPARLP